MKISIDARYLKIDATLLWIYLFQIFIYNFFSTCFTDRKCNVTSSRIIAVTKSFTVIKRTRCTSGGKFSDADATLFLKQRLRMALEFADAKFRDNVVTRELGRNMKRDERNCSANCIQLYLQDRIVAGAISALY